MNLGRVRHKKQGIVHCKINGKFALSTGCFVQNPHIPGRLNENFAKRGKITWDQAPLWGLGRKK